MILIVAGGILVSIAKKKAKDDSTLTE